MEQRLFVGYDDAGNKVYQVVVDEAKKVIENPLIGVSESYTITINAAAELPADSTAVTPAEVITVTPTAGFKRCIVTFFADEGMTPFAVGANVTLNANDTTIAASRLSIADYTEGASLTSAASKDAHKVSKNRGLMYDLSGLDSTIEKISLVGIATGGTGAASKSHIELVFI
ncbi:MAG: hypothetical protein OEY66_07135 [Gammaproteobacteria bacterium]|nr:hypothetical protein [Gammaproteobacteria bacterium]